jgi:hypothetical protein
LVIEKSFVPAISDLRSCSCLGLEERLAQRANPAMSCKERSGQSKYLILELPADVRQVADAI